MRLLDLYCGIGGAAKGYSSAGFEIVGVDIQEQPDYPFEFRQADALEMLAEMPANEFHFIHASPPCQRWSKAGQQRDRHNSNIHTLRHTLRNIGKPYAIENVIQAPLVSPVLLCWSMFNEPIDGAQLMRHRHFETNWGLKPKHPCSHKRDAITYSVVGRLPLNDYAYAARRMVQGRTNYPSFKRAQELMGIDWTRRGYGGLCEAVPPCYTEFIGREWMKTL